MKTFNHNKVILILGFSVLIFLASCRKKDEKYEGTYVGMERYTILDSGETAYTLDTSYQQVIEFTYSKKVYTFLRVHNNPTQAGFSIHKKNIEDHKYQPFSDIYTTLEGNTVGSGGGITFANDSMYYGSWSSWNHDETLYEFRGKR